MLFFIGFLIFNILSCASGSNGGSAIFHKRFSKTGCWNEEDIAKLRARSLFEQIVPQPVTPDRINSKYVRDIIRYYRHALHSTDTEQDQRTSVVLKDALADTIGGHLRSEVLPTTRFAYYAGYVPYVKVRELHDFYDSIKTMLNTQGLGWKLPGTPQWSNLTVGKIIVGDGKYFDPCSSLIIKRDSSSCFHISSPKLDDLHEPSAMALPLKTGGLVSLTSPDSENILLKYYTTASRCILNSSPATCRHTDFVNFNNDMWHWMKRRVAPHLADEKLYAAYGGVLRIAAAVQSYGKGLSKRNPFDVRSDEGTKWHLWKSLTDTYVYVNTDWTPHLYVGVVVLAGVSICLMQMCYAFISGDAEGCSCKGHPKESFSNDVEYANIESNIPAMLPSHHSAVYNEQMRAIHPDSNIKSSSVGTFQTQKVYDLNEDTEKFMNVIVSEKETNEGTETSGQTEIASDDTGSKRTPSPPKIETDVSQVQLSRHVHNLQLYSSSATRSEMTFRQRGGDVHTESSEWSGSSSEQSMSSTTSKSRCRQSRSSRDLAWARRVASKHTLRKSISGTDLDYTSYTTPPSKR